MARSKDRVGDYHRQFAEKLIEQIKEKRAPFQKPWKPGERSLPENLATGRRYRGGNSLYLSVAAQDKGYTDNRWATYRQIAAAGGHVHKGEKGTKVLFFSAQKVKQAKDEQGRPRLTESGEPVYERRETVRPYVRMYTVFNAEQTSDLPPRPPASPEPEWKAHEQAETIIETSGVDVRHQAGDRAYYNVRTDQVVLPEPGQFPSAGNYYQTALHELGHATGHPDRLNRDTLGKKFGSPDYAREELRAEIAAMMTGERIGLGHQPQNGADYIAGWVKALEDDPREIYRAAADAEKISRYLIEPARERIEQRENDTPEAPAREHERERSPKLTPAPELQAAAARQQAATDFNRNIQRAADAALDGLTHDGHESRPSNQLVRDLQAVRLAAAQKVYTPATVDFRSLRSDLHDHAILADGLTPDQRKAVLGLADNFSNQAQGHGLTDFERLDLNEALADATSHPPEGFSAPDRDLDQSAEHPPPYAATFAYAGRQLKSLDGPRDATLAVDLATLERASSTSWQPDTTTLIAITNRLHAAGFDQSPSFARTQLLEAANRIRPATDDRGPSPGDALADRLADQWNRNPDLAARREAMLDAIANHERLAKQGDYTAGDRLSLAISTRLSSAGLPEDLEARHRATVQLREEAATTAALALARREEQPPIYKRLQEIPDRPITDERIHARLAHRPSERANANPDLNQRIQAATTAGLAAVRNSPEQLHGDRRVLLSTLHDIDNQATAGDFDNQSKFSATAQRLHDYAARHDPGLHRDAINNAAHAFRQLPSPERAINHRIVDATQDALHYLGEQQDDHADLGDYREELVQDLARVNTTALNNGYRPGDSLHATADHLDSFSRNDQVQSPELSQAADRLRAAQHSLDRAHDAAPDRAERSSPDTARFHPSITLRDRVDAALERQGMSEEHRESFLRHLDTTEGGLAAYAARHQIEDPAQIRARETSPAAQALAASHDRALERDDGPTRG